MSALSGRLRVSASLLAALVLGFGAPAAGQAGERVNPDHDFAKFMFEVMDFAQQAEAIHILSQYCRPPYSPQKGEAQWEIDFLRLMMKRARVDHQRFQNRAKASFGSRAGMSYIGGFPRVDGIDLSVDSFERYFAAALREILKVEAILNKKQEQLDKALLRDCGQVEGARTTPPGDPTPTANPADGLTRPTPRPLIYPELPPYFCSREAKAEFLTNFRRTVERDALANGQDANNYDATVSERANDFDRAGQRDVANRLRRTEGRWAIDNAKAREKDINNVEAFRQKILAIDIVDCDPDGKRIAAIPAPASAPVRVGVGGDIAIFPKFERTVGDQAGILRYSSNQRVNGVTAFLERQSRSWLYGLAFRTGRHEFTQDWQSGLGLPTRTIGSATGYFVTPYVARPWGVSKHVSVDFSTGPVIGFNRLSYRWLTVDEYTEDTRTHVGVQWGLGSSLSVEHPSGWGGRFSVNYVGLIESADNYNSLSINLSRRFGALYGTQGQRGSLPRERRDR